MYTGTRRYTDRMSTALKGVVDAGLEGSSGSPPEERINGDHLTVKNDVKQMKSTIDGETQ